jgi:hypothetical protein
MSLTNWAAVVGVLGCMALEAVFGCSSSGVIDGKSGSDAGLDSSSGGCAPGQPGCPGAAGNVDAGGGEAAATGCAACSGATPVCVAGQCVACASDSDCPSTGTSCAVSACVSNACVTAKTALGTACMDHGGIVCDGQGTCTRSHCGDGVQDADETSVDCGGSTCGKCAPGATCKVNTDCLSGDCSGGSCVTCGTATSTETCCPDGTGVRLVDTQTTCASEGTQWISCDGRFGLIMQTDGNLVLYQGPCLDTRCGTPIWASNTQSCGGCVTMQSDGNFVVYGTAGQVAGDACWASGTNGHAGAYLQLQDDGDLVMYPPPGDAGVFSDGGPDAGLTSIWSSNTGGH